MRNSSITIINCVLALTVVVLFSRTGGIWTEILAGTMEY